MLAKFIRLLIISSLLLLTACQLPFDSGSGPRNPDSSSPKDQPADDETSWLEQLWQSVWQDFSNWLDQRIQEQSAKLEELIEQYWQDLVDSFVQQATQKFEDLLQQSCGTALLLPTTAIAGVWYLHHRKHR